MKVLVVGAGAREHALAWKIKQSPKVSQLFVAPGNAGTALIAQNLPIPATDIHALLKAAQERDMDLTVVGPEAPLALGIVDLFTEKGLKVFGPTRAAARIEVSKAFAKDLMARYGIPTPRFRVFSQYEEALDYVKQQGPPLVIKADGLAAGKGSLVAETEEAAVAALKRLMVDRVFGAAGDRVVVEERLVGREVSVFAFSDGEALSSPVAACDYKRLLDGDRGPNTGGMGSYSPPEFWNPALAEQVQKEILEPTLQALAREGTPYCGVLYAGLMVTEGGPQVLEFNCRFGDPEAQVILPRLETDLVDILLGVVERRLDRLEIRWRDQACVGVVLASQGYPEEYQKGLPIHGLEEVGDETLLFHAGTRRIDGSELVTDGGRVLTVTALGPSLGEARERAYAGVRRIHFQGCSWRKDIAAGLE